GPAPGQDVAGRVHVTVEDQTAVAPVCAYGEGLRGVGKAPAAAASLRRSACINLDHFAPSFFRFGAQRMEEVAPSRVPDALRESGAGEATDVQVLNSDGVVAPDEIQRGLEVEVAARSSHGAVLRGQDARGLPAPSPATLATRDTSLGD